MLRLKRFLTDLTPLSLKQIKMKQAFHTIEQCAVLLPISTILLPQVPSRGNLFNPTLACLSYKIHQNDY